ncbi:MAG TPA: DUF748 domain-containing protein [Nitrospiraceae bacterium]|nr:DUF748 domain-containing protein [Nitrospiraceae bacterium]
MRWLLRPSRLAVIALSVVLVYSLVGFFLVPYLIKVYAIPAVAEKLKRPVLVQEVELNPFTLSLRLTGFEIRETDQSALLGFEEFFVNLQASSLIHRAYVFDTIRLTAPYVSARISKDGRVNLAELVPPDDGSQPSMPQQAEKTPAEIPAIEIGEFEIAQAIVEFRDESKPKPYVLDIVPIHIVLKNFYTKPGGDNSYAFTAELDKGETFSWAGTVSLEPLRSSGKFSLSGVKLPRLWQYVHDRYHFDITDGTVAVDAGYSIDVDATPIGLQVSQANIRVEKLAIREDGSLDPAITIPALNVEGVDVNLATREVTAREIAVMRAWFTAWLNPDGTLNYQQMFAPVDSPPPPAAGNDSAKTKDEKPWTVWLKEIRLEDHAIDFEDRTLPTPAEIEVRSLTVKTRDVRIPIKDALPIEVGLKLNETGTIHVNGSVLPNPLQANVVLALKDIAIRPFQPYFEKFVRTDVQSGAVNLNGTVRFSAEHPKGPLLAYEGSVRVEGLSVADRDQRDEVTSLQTLSLNKIVATVDPTTVSIQEVGLEQPMAHVVVGPDGGLNIGRLVVAAPPSARAEEKPMEPQKAKGPPVPITIGMVKLTKAAATFRDNSVQPPAQTGIFNLTGTIKGLSSKQLARADVDLSGRVGTGASLKIAGRINPLSDDAFTDVTISLGGMDLTAQGPYSRKYVGYGLSKGKLSLDLKYKISQKLLEAENRVVVDQLTFGEKFDSPDATSLPVMLAVALLKDRQGRIDIDLPIRGDLKDPDFKYGKAVVSVLLNLLTKIVASPFTLIGSLVPGGGAAEELQYLEFDPGAAAVVSTELKKVEAIAKGLEERPGLRLEVTGTADPVRDRQVLALQKLKAQLHAKWQQGKGVSKGADFPIAEEERAIKELFDKQRSLQPVAGTAEGEQVPSKPPSIEEMRQQLAAGIPVPDSDLRLLAEQRAEQLRGQLVVNGNLADERVFLTEVDLTAADHERVRSRLNITAGQ